MGRGHSEVDGGGGGSEVADQSGDVKEEARQIRRGDVVDGREGAQEEFEFNSLLNRELVELLTYGGDVMIQSSGDLCSGYQRQMQRSYKGKQVYRRGSKE